MGLIDYRQAYKPFEYPELEKFTDGIRNTYWLHTEVDFTKDVHEFQTELSETEKYIVGTILKTFAQTEVHVADEFWSRIYDYLPKPEVFAMCSTFTENELRHASAYDRLNEVLGLTDYDSFLEDDVANSRLENLMKIRRDLQGKASVKDICRTLAVFSGFVESVNLFSQFAILRSFSSNGRNLLTNIADIIDWSQLDEQIHGQAGLYLFDLLKQENPEIWDDEFKSDLYQAARTTYDIEVNLIDQIFAKGELPNLDKKTLLNFMKNRINNSLNTMGLKSIYNIDEELLLKVSWFEDNFKAVSHKDFFAKRPSEYTKNLVSFNKESVQVSKEEILNIK